jgi:hypothetical protein
VGALCYSVVAAMTSRLNKSNPVTVNNDVLNGHVAPDIQCLDRIYLNVHMLNLQLGGQVVTFLARHR